MSEDTQPNSAPEGVETIVVPRTVDLADDFKVHRALPSARRRMVGPFVFLDEMGPGALQPGKGLDVRPHPHIGLATVTYLFEGEILHRDSLGTVETIRAGELNWMTAGRGIVHSERTPAHLRQSGSRLFGIQAWVALPRAHEETAPSFVHHGTGELPVIEGEDKRVRVVVGELHGTRSPVRALTQMVYADVALAAGAELAVPAQYEERAAYIVEGAIELSSDRTSLGANQLVVFRPGVEVVMRAQSYPVRLMLLGGEAMDGPRHIWWNFVSSSVDRIERAKADWKAGAFAPVPEETEFIPLPDR